MMRSDAYINVTCDHCGDAEEVMLTALAGGGYDDRYVDSQLEEWGWVISEEGDYCSDECAEVGRTESLAHRPTETPLP